VEFSLTIALLALAFSQANAASLIGKVVRVADGDTVTVLDVSNTQHRIRLQGIDAPERKQPFGRKSGEYLANAVAGKTVVVEWDKRDRYGRIVGKVVLEGEDMNLRQIEGGLAWHYKKYAVEQSGAAVGMAKRCASSGRFSMTESDPKEA
jgi:endonuclease YncB( thermonuclease family)